MGIEILVPISLFAMVAAIVVVPIYFKSKERREMQETVRRALDKGQALPAELVDAIARSERRRRATAHTDLRTGVIWLAIAGGSPSSAG
jgi:Na+/H+ antiporter NhaD/arsenite permease-like protein